MTENKIFAYIDFKIKDHDAFKDYSKAVADTMIPYGGKTVGVKIGADFIIGNKDVDVQVIQEWPNKQRLELWLNSPEYAPLKEIRDTKAMENLTISIVNTV